MKLRNIPTSSVVANSRKRLMLNGDVELHCNWGWGPHVHSNFILYSIVIAIYPFVLLSSLCHHSSNLLHLLLMKQTLQFLLQVSLCVKPKLPLTSPRQSGSLDAHFIFLLMVHFCFLSFQFSKDRFHFFSNVFLMSALWNHGLIPLNILCRIHGRGRCRRAD